MATMSVVRRLAIFVVGLVAVTLLGPPAVAAPPSTDVIVLPGASSAEGIATGHGATFYAGDLYAGDIFRGNLRRGTAELFIDAPAGRGASGLKVDTRHDLLFVAGGANGEAYVYDTQTGETLATYRFAPQGAPSYVNDVALTPYGAWFTDSFRPELYFVPITRDDSPGPAQILPLSGPAADTSQPFNLNGIEATPSGRTLIVAHYGNGALATVDPRTGASATIAGVSVPEADGILLRGRRLWVAQAFQNTVSEVRLSGDLATGYIEEVITSDLFAVPTTVALYGNKLAVVNSHFDTGVPPTADQYEIVLVRA
jgi:hypothetical protein